MAFVLLTMPLRLRADNKLAVAAGAMRDHRCAALLAMVVCAWGGSTWWLLRYQGDVLFAGRRASALLTNAEEQLHRLRDQALARAQAELLAAAKSDRLVMGVLARLLSETPAAARVRVALVHDGTVSLAAMHMMHFSTTHALAAPGYDPGEMLQDQPLSRWSDFLAAIIAKPGCVLKRTGEMTDPVAVARMRAHGTDVVIICGIFSPGRQFIGAMFTSFDRLGYLPADLTAIMARNQRAAAEIGTAVAAISGNGA